MPTDKPVWLLDVDGVLNALRPASRNKAIWSDWKSFSMHFLGQSWPLVVSYDVVRFIKRIHEEDKAEIRWHTTWQHEAYRLAKELGLPHFPVHEAPEFDSWRSMRSDSWWKLGGGLRVVREEQRPLVWTDDHLDDNVDPYLRDALVKDHVPGLLICPDARKGLVPAHLELIERFLTAPGHVVDLTKQEV